MKPTTIFITYNPNNDDEQTLAIRLHTIGAVNGFKMYLPDRYNSETYLDTETKHRIDESDYVVLFSMKPKLSNIVKEEIEYAWNRLHDKSKIIVIYNAKKNLTGKMVDHFTEIFFNPHIETVDTVTVRILDVIFHKSENKAIDNLGQTLVVKNSPDHILNALLALLGIGLGLVVLNEVMKK